MKLNTHEYGSGDRVALLVHGMLSDHRTWRLVAPALADRGYRVIAVDLRGHGESGRGEYSPELFAQDLVDTLPAGAELAIGHSLGGLTLSLAVDRLAPARAVFSDPGWKIPAPGDDFDPSMFLQFAQGATAESVAAMNPRWAPEDVEIELRTLALWDPATLGTMGALGGRDLMPAAPVVPSLVQVADPSFLLSVEDQETLRERGFEVRVVKGAGHTIHRDDFEGFMSSLDGWI
ncbi:alpha/beta fold hydrolase [Streptacidiphilus jiangxiensis]|uniref:Alpha/beta hydrolase family protein n=1 Tax=Streptacidiphilus jiangxiensis TaxID=235985 RepID=A0A1H7W526_STRJI|nr:alpha/beta hydrolase [Streptacidiphilus jiangxiensis]SEM16087.1 Alpha/beta hydrolase family protein [Streptacidiphilus jiangxiensis]